MSSLIKRHDQGSNEDIVNINDKRQRYCNDKSFYENNNI